VLALPGKLVAGNDLGAFVSTNGGAAWSVLGTGLPNVPVVHVVADPANANRIVAATYGRGAYSYTFAK
jgi:hypothetical protein